MNKGKVGGFATLFLIFVVIVGCLICVERIPTGSVGVVYQMNGGVQDELLTQGFHLVSPTKKVKEFTIGNEQVVLSKDKRDGSEDNDSFLVSTADNANIRISFQMSYRYDQSKVLDTFKKFKGMSGEQIMDQRVRTVLKAKVSEVTTNYSMMDIYSGNRGEINAKLTEFLNKELGKNYGIEVIDASIIDVHPDEQLQKTIDDRVTAMQKKQQAQAEQETIKVQAETKILEAKAEAEKMDIETQAEAKRYRDLSAAITPELIQKWEMDARNKHGWVTINGGNVITDERK